MRSTHIHTPSNTPATSSNSQAADSARAELAGHGSDESYPIVVHSHLRWDWVWQRPQQFLSRLSHRHPILYIEEPVGAGSKAAARLCEVKEWPNVLRIKTEVPKELLSDREALDSVHQRLVLNLFAGPLGKQFKQPVHWFYDPMAISAFGGQLEERLTVYDCMDQLSQFRGAPPELVRREQALLAASDVVFAGGPKIHKEKRLSNVNCHCYGCGVDVAHFGAARHLATKIPADIARLPRPLAGYFGVVDERLDYELIDELSLAHPEWSIVIIGPATKVDPDSLPKRANLHWLGAREYRELPAYVKGMDVCLMPFALNEATAFINPTKALEYMSTARPVVSTAVEDVVLQFSHVIEIARSHAAFIRACERAVAEPNRRSIESGLELAQKNSWEAIVEALEGHIATALVSRRGKEIFAL